MRRADISKSYAYWKDMMHKDKQRSVTVCFAAVLLVCFFTQATEGFRLTKKENRDGQKKVDAGDTVNVHEGEIVFGRALETSSQPWKDSPNASVEDEGTYQADSPGWLKGSSHDQSSKEARWRRMMPSVQCSLDHMRFKAMGPGTSQLTLAQGNGPALPLSQIPPSCGFNMQRNALALVMSVPYDGCNVFQEGGNYVLPLRWQGIPLLLLCTKPTGSPLTTATSYYPTTQVAKSPPPKIYIPQTQSYQVPDTPQILLPNKYPDVSEPKLPHPIFFPPRPYPEYPPLSVGDSAIPIKKHFPQYHPVPALYPYLPPPFPVAPAAPPALINSVGQTVLDPSQMFYFHMYPPMFPHPHLPPPGLLPGVPQSSTMTELSGKPPVPQIQPYMPFLPPPVFPHAHPHTHLHYPTDPKQDITVPPTTTEKSDTMHPYQHSHSFAHSHLPSPHIYAHSHFHSHPHHPQSVPPPHSHPHLLPQYLLQSHSLAPQSDQPPSA